MKPLPVEQGFPPVVGAGPKLLILGSLPGRKSLLERQYYAQPHNAFWKIMRELCAAGPELAYGERLAKLAEQGVALWDVLAAGQRPGSLDAAIVKATAISNDFQRFFVRNESIRLICFNGKTAAALYTRRVMPRLSPDYAAIRSVTLPSTSPAYAAMRFEEKLARWSAVISPILR